MTTEIAPYVAGAPDLPDPAAQLRRYVRMGGVVMAMLVFGLGGLAAVVQLTSAIVAFGDVTAESGVRRLAHPTGGVIATIEVRNGDKVKAGQVLMRFDTTVSGVGSEVAAKSLDELLAQQARLRAERDELPAIAWPADLLTSRSPAAQAAMASESRLFSLRRAARLGQQAQLRQRVAQLESQISSYRTQIGASRSQSALIEPERDGMRSLYAKKLVTVNRMNELERTAVALTANAASLEANIAQARAQISEVRSQAITLAQDARSQAGVELAEVTARVADSRVRKASAGDTFDRSLIRAPQSGTVDKLAYNTIGGVVPAAQTIMEIVPDTDRMTVEAKVSPADIDQVRSGQPATLRFSAFNMRTTPEVGGTVKIVSAERVNDDRTGTSYYTVRLEIPPAELAKLGDLKLVPGMPVEAFIQTGRRSMLSYLFKPIADQLSRSFRQS